MTDREAIKYLLELLKKNKKDIGIIIMCLLISTIISLFMPLLSSKLMDEGFIGMDKQIVIKLVLVAFSLHIVISLLDVLEEKKRIDISNRIKINLEESAFIHLIKVKIGYFRDKNSMQILDAINTDIHNISAVVDDRLLFVVTQVLRMIGGAVGLFILDYRLTILVLLFFPIKYFVMLYFAKYRKKLMTSYIVDAQNYAGWLGDTINGVKEIKLFGILEVKHKELLMNKCKVIEKEKRIAMMGQWNGIIDSLLVQIMMICIYIFGVDLVLNLELSVGSIFAFVTYSSYVTSPISAILNIGYFFSGIIPSTKRYYEFINYEEEQSVEETQYVKDYVEGDIIFENIAFSYDGQEKILDDISIRVQQNSKTAIVGANGSGKSTIVNLLLRFYEPQSGNIYIGEKNIRDIPLEIYRSMISVVSQDVYLFNDTIRNNITLFKKVDDDKIREACERSGLKDFIDTVTLDYCVGDDGAMLSGGQKQKVALARALIHDRPIVVLDEATSNVDNNSVKQVNSLLKTILKDKTVIVISHQAEMLSEVEYVVELNNGRVKE